MSAVNPQRRRLQAGYTLSELTMVVAIIGIASGIAAPSVVHMLSSQRNLASAERFYSMASLASTLTSQTGSPHLLVLDHAQHKIEVRSDENNNGVLDRPDRLIRRVDIERGVAIGPEVGYSQAPLPRPYAFILPNSSCSFCQTPGVGTLTFLPDGRMLDADGTPLMSAHVSFVPESDLRANNREHVRLVTIVGYSGHIRMWSKEGAQ